MRTTPDNSATYKFTDLNGDEFIIASLDKDAQIENGTTVDCIKSTKQGQPDQTKQKAIYINGTWYLFEENLKFKDVIDQTEYYIVTETRDEIDENGNLKKGAVSTCISIDKADTNPTKKDAIYVGNTWYIKENLQKHSLTFIQDNWNTEDDPEKYPFFPDNRSKIEEETLKKLGLPKNYAEFQKYKILYQIIQAKNEQGIIEFLKKEENKGLDFKGFFAASNGESLLYSLAKHNFFNAINILKEYGYDVTKDEGYKGYYEDGSYTTSSALFIAVEKGHTATIEALEEAGYDLTKDTGHKIYYEDGSYYTYSALYQAIRHEEEMQTPDEIVSLLLSKGYPIDDDLGHLAYNENGNIVEQTRPLTRAIEQQLPGITSLLLLAHQPEKPYNSPDYTKITYYSLLADIKEETSLLYLAAKDSKYLYLIQKGSYPVTADTGLKRTFKNGKLIEEKSVLFLAAQNGHTATIKALKDAGYDLTKDEGYKKYKEDGSYTTCSALFIAVENGHTATIKALIKAGYDLKEDTGCKIYKEDGSYTTCSALFIAAQKGDTATIKALKDAGYDLKKDAGCKIYKEDGSYDTYSALFIAAQKGDTATIEALEEAGYDLTKDEGYKKYNKNGKLIEEKSALFLAAQNGHTATIKALKDAGYDLKKDEGYKIYKEDGSYTTCSALFLAAQKGHTATIKALKDAGYDLKKDAGCKIYKEDGSYNTYSALFIAAQKGDTATIEALEEAGYDLTKDEGYKKYNKDGKLIEEKSALFLAAQKGDTATIKALIKAGYDLKEDTGYKKYNDFDDYETYSALYAATQNEHPATIEALKEAGYDLTTDTGYTRDDKKYAIYVGNTWYIKENLQKHSLTFIQDNWNTEDDPEKYPFFPDNSQEMDSYILQQLGLPKNYTEFQKYKTLYQIIQATNEEGIIEFLKNKENKGLDFKGFFAASNGESLLYSLAKHNFFNAINILKEYEYDFKNDTGYKIYKEDGSYTTCSALFIAVENGHTATIKALKEAGYDLTTDTGYTRDDKDDLVLRTKRSLPDPETAIEQCTSKSQKVAEQKSGGIGR